MLSNCILVLLIKLVFYRNNFQILSPKKTFMQTLKVAVPNFQASRPFFIFNLLLYQLVELFKSIQLLICHHHHHQLFEIPLVQNIYNCMTCMVLPQVLSLL